MIYLIWNKTEVSNLGFENILTEVDSSGSVIREIGLNEKEDVVHFAPSAKSPRGYFDLQKIDISKLKSNFSNTKFEELWKKANADFEMGG